MAEFMFRLEMSEGQSQRQVDADSFVADDLWLIFYRNGREYWRANRDKVVSMESRHSTNTAPDSSAKGEALAARSTNDGVKP